MSAEIRETPNYRSPEDIRGYAAKQKDKALVVRDAKSMAENTIFEKAAKEWEDVFGGVAYNDQRAKKVVDDGAEKAVDYFKKKANEWEEGNKALQNELAKVQITDPGWSGGVGDRIEAVMRAFKTGPLGVKIAHLENFCNKVLAEDVLKRNEKELDDLLNAAKINRDNIQPAITRIKKNRSPYALHDIKGSAADQWHMRAKRYPNDLSKNVSERTVKEVEDLGVKLDKDEKSFMNISEESDRLNA